jgi:hypothetical protein
MQTFSYLGLTFLAYPSVPLASIVVASMPIRRPLQRFLLGHHKHPLALSPDHVDPQTVIAPPFMADVPRMGIPNFIRVHIECRNKIWMITEADRFPGAFFYRKNTRPFPQAPARLQRGGRVSSVKHSKALLPNCRRFRRQKIRRWVSPSVA